MQLDNTRIAIRERGFPEILDLSLRVIRAHGLPLLVALAVGVVPCQLLNYCVLSWLMDRIDLGYESPGWYLFFFVLLVVWEMPLATAPLTLYLGQALFVEGPSTTAIARAWQRRCRS